MKLKVIVQVTLTLPPGAEVIENIQSEGEDMGPHIKAGGKLFRPSVNWLVFEPRCLLSETERKLGHGHRWRTCDDRDYDAFLADEENPDHPYTLEVVE
jgi:hypothetical protein